MPFIPKIILLDKGTNKYEFEAYDILAQNRGEPSADNMVKQYITLNPNHEFVQYLFSASDVEGYNIYGFVVKVPYDIDIEQFEKLKTPLMDGYKDMDLNESEPSLREEQIEKNRMAEEARKESYKNLMEIKSMSDKHNLDGKKKFITNKDYDSPEYMEHRKKRMEIAQKYKEAREHYANTESTNLGGTKRRKRRTKKTKKRRS